MGGGGDPRAARVGAGEDRAVTPAEAGLTPKDRKIDFTIGDCLEVLKDYPENHFDSCVTDPPYGLEFMGKEWDKLTWESGGGFSKPGIGERETAWPSFSSTSRFGTANPTCAKCGGRLRGKKKCGCEKPEWKPIGKRRKLPQDTPDYLTGGGMSAHLSKMQQWHTQWAKEVYRVLKPGAHLLAMGGDADISPIGLRLRGRGLRDSRHADVALRLRLPQVPRCEQGD